MKKALLLIFLLGLQLNKACAQLTASGYSNINLSGFNVLVEDSAYILDATLTQDAVNLLETKLQEISQLCISQEILDTLKATSIFVDWNTTSGGAQYHPDLAWLLANGYIPEKEKCVEISNIANFVAWTNLNQPYMVLHELSHAYHHRMFNFMNSDITNAYNHAVSVNLYHNVQYHYGNGVYSTQPNAYALTDEREYFAELSEAYFGLNDYYPFTVSDLQSYDPDGYSALQNVWTACTTGIENSENDPEVLIYPNPSTGTCTLNIPWNSASPIEWTLYDMQGRSIRNETGMENKLWIEFILPEAGIYFVRVKTGEHSTTKYIVRQ